MRPSQWAVDLLAVSAASFVVTLAVSWGLAHIIQSVITPLAR